MKYLLIIAAIGFLFSCKSSTKNEKTEQSHVKKYDTSDVAIQYILSPQTWRVESGAARKVVYQDSVIYTDDTLSNGDITKKKTSITDSFYLLPTADTTLTVIDKDKKPILDALGNKQYYLTFRTPLSLPSHPIHNGPYIWVKDFTPIPPAYKIR